jgi:hypothetical protein
MMNTMLRSSYILGACLVLAIGCDSVTQYSGDGRMVDNGRGAATDRYIVDLGEVSLRSPASFTFRLSNLPKESFVVGLQLRAKSPTLDSKFIAPLVSLSLRENGKPVFSKEARLSEWTWSVPSGHDTAFVYGRGEPDTKFNAVAGRTYELVIAIKEPDRSTADYSASLLAKSAGWK